MTFRVNYHLWAAGRLIPTHATVDVDEPEQAIAEAKRQQRARDTGRSPLGYFQRATVDRA